MWTVISPNASEFDRVFLNKRETVIVEHVRAASTSWWAEFDRLQADTANDDSARARWREQHEPPFVYVVIDGPQPILGVVPRGTFFAEKEIPKRARQVVNNMKAKLPAICTCVVVLYRPETRVVTVAVVEPSS